VFIGGDDAAGQPATALERFDPMTGALSAMAELAPPRWRNATLGDAG
jgi:hypothetical protein